MHIIYHYCKHDNDNLPKLVIRIPTLAVGPQFGKNDFQDLHENQKVNLLIGKSGEILAVRKIFVILYITQRGPKYQMMAYEHA